MQSLAAVGTLLQSLIAETLQCRMWWASVGVLLLVYGCIAQLRMDGATSLDLLIAAVNVDFEVQSLDDLIAEVDENEVGSLNDLIAAVIENEVGSLDELIDRAQDRIPHCHDNCHSNRTGSKSYSQYDYHDSYHNNYCFVYDYHIYKSRTKRPQITMTSMR